MFLRRKHGIDRGEDIVAQFYRERIVNQDGLLHAVDQRRAPYDAEKGGKAVAP